MVHAQFTAIDVVGLLIHSSVCFGRDRGTLSALREIIDLSILRGMRGKPGLDGLIAAVHKAHHDPASRQRRLSEEEAEALTALLTDMQRILAPLIAPLKRARRAFYRLPGQCRI